MKLPDFLTTTANKLEHFERELSVIKDPDRLAKLSQQASQWAERILPQIENFLAGLRREFTTQYAAWGFTLSSDTTDGMIPRIIPAHDFRAKMGRFGARLMEGFEAVFNAWLALKIWAVDGTLLTNIMVTLATLGFCEGFGWLLASLLNNRSDVPEESRRVVNRVLASAAIAWLTSFYLTCVLRVATGGIALALVPFTSLIFGVLEIATLILVAVGFASVQLYGWSRRDFETYSRYLELYNRVQALILKSGAPAPPSEPELKRSAIRPLKSVNSNSAAALLIGFTILSAAAPATLRAQGASDVTVTEGASFLDVSTSTSTSGRASALDAHRAIVVPTMLKLGITNWSFIQFTNDAWSATIVTTAHGATNPSAACGAVQFSEAGKLFAPSRQQEISEAQERCRNARDAAMKGLQESVNSSIDILLKNNASRPSKCTSVLDSIERAAQTPGLRAVIIVTDGNENCGMWRRVAPPDHPLALVIVLIGEKDDAITHSSEGMLFEKRKQRLLNAAPWATIVPVFQLSTELFKRPTTLLVNSH